MAFPRSFQDPLYASLAAQAEQEYGLPAGILDAIRLRGERSNADQVSSAGARTPYQFIPSTRQGVVKNYGVDPWQDPQSATVAAAQLLRENKQRGGSWNKAIAMYAGGNNPGTTAQRYQARVGDFDTTKPYYTGADEMPQSLYPVTNGYDPLAPEPMMSPVPVQGSAAPSVNAPAASPVASKKRGGILGALESVFMPDPSSRWAGALRDGLFNAKESQQNYIEGQAGKMLNLELANQKLKQLQQHGEYQVVGNNVFHVKPDGTTEMISGPSSTDDKTKLIDLWKARHEANPSDPTLPLLEGLILGGANTPEAMAARQSNAETIARIRAGATTGAARIRANAPHANNANIMPPMPLGAKVIH
jgi:soluble lytic murein transglycosylase-like protein